MKTLNHNTLGGTIRVIDGIIAGVVLYVLFALFSTGLNITFNGDKVAAVPQQQVHAGALTDYAENKIVDATLRAQAIGTPVTWYVALYTTCPTDSTAGTEAIGGAYARVAITAGLAGFSGTQAAGSTVASSGTGGTASNNAVITFPTPSATWGTVVCWAITDAATLGNIWIYSALTVSKVINTGDAVSFAAGAATFQIDN